MKRIEESDLVLKYSKRCIRRAFYDVLSSAKKRDELVCGVYTAAEVLRRRGVKDVQFCVLVQSDDPANHVFCRLIEAYCCENRIQVIKVDRAEVLTYLCDDNPSDFHHCVLVQNSTALVEEDSMALQVLLNYTKYKEAKSVLKIG
ncbi:growth arrest and DNA damage-inducible protein GADD45 gamma-like [Xenia sp. Carnegie-2017]|uniref:growth arrest and DNA damage-inducible protein GADD45 gamma-like n=1 Tax=Xenia sp. Carnegie-2017 TaxID=2897299 RepID=UPI001F0342DD|nr:growth arrest and DNA damage-inducible protein GADD45 gamma-like [Xenia sp. Carnegie-2017]